MIFGISLILVGIYGIMRNRNNLILILISIEVISLGIFCFVIFATNFFDDEMTEAYCVVILIIAGIESAIGLSIMVWYFRKNGSLTLFKNIK